jgi:hypothetical protein
MAPNLSTEAGWSTRRHGTILLGAIDVAISAISSPTESYSDQGIAEDARISSEVIDKIIRLGKKGMSYDWDFPGRFLDLPA